MNEGIKIQSGNLGFFSHPVTYGKDHVLKKYRGTLTSKQAVKLEQLHSRFIAELKAIGINIPETKMEFNAVGRKYQVCIIQEKFLENELAGQIIKNSSEEKVVNTTVAIMKDGIKFIDSGLLDTMGFHPTVRNYAFRGDKAFYLDTFPPYGTVSETREMVIRHAPSLFMRLVLSIGYPFLGVYLNEYYDPVEMLSGIVGTSTRLRPEYAEEIKKAALILLQQRQDSWKDKTVIAIKTHPQKLSKWNVGQRIKKLF